MPRRVGPSDRRCYRRVRHTTGSHGDLQALAASDLRHVRIEIIETFGEPFAKIHLELHQPVDLALWQDAHGKQHGVIQGDGEIPRNWSHGQGIGYEGLTPPNNAKR